MDLFVSIFLVFVLNTGIVCSQSVNNQLNSSQTAAYTREYIICPTSEFCSNGGTCYMEVNKKFPLYYCKCPDKFYGETCQFKQTNEPKDCQPDVADNFCMNGGSCYADIFMNNTVNYCQCSKKFWGARCESISPGKVNPCPPSVAQTLCLNEGTCYESIMDGVKYDFCACTPEYIGHNCAFKVVQDNSSTILNELLCLNKGVCNRVMWEDVEIFDCSCQQGFYGDRCEYRSSATSSLCSDQNFCNNGGTCYEEVFGTKKVFFCSCMKGYTGQRCEMTVSTESQVCQDLGDKFCANGGTCFQVQYQQITHRYCECTYQFGGARCEKKLPIESACPPQLDTETCENNGTCLSIDTGREQGAYMCKCADGYYGPTCEYRFPLQLMHSACPPELLESFCSSRGTCYKDIIMNRPFYYCECSNPYRGVRCEINILENSVSCPEDGKDLCHNGGVCTQVVTHFPILYVCQCKEKTYGARCEYCYIGEIPDYSCPPPLDKVLCKNGGTCVRVSIVPGEPSYYCSCPEGLYGISCEYPYSVLAVKDDCPSDMDKTFCLNGGTCYKEEITGNTVYVCECLYPYTGERCELMSTEKLNCSPEINIGLKCLNNGLCTYRMINGLKVYVCECKEGYFGARCEHKVLNKYKECSKRLCMNGGVCISFKETLHGQELTLYYCKCVAGFFGVLCEYPPHSSHDTHLSCPDKYCEHGGTCYASILNGKPVYYCDCRERYHGIRCEFQYPSTKCPQDIAQHLCLHGTCIRLQSNGVDSYQCVCNEGFVGDRCEHGKSDKSDNEDICSPPFSGELCKNNGTCVRIPTEKVGLSNPLYYCICPRGFYGTVCQYPYHPGLAIHEPCRLDVQSYCLNGGTCYRRYINNQSVSACECVAPYYGARCEYSLRFKNNCKFPFNRKLCVGGTCTQQISHGQIVYSCLCHDGWYGARCEHRQEDISHYELCPHPLENSLCANGGSCVACKFKVNGSLYFCKCKEGYYGLSCEHIIPQHKDCPNEIEKEWCLNGGTCFAEYTMSRVVYQCKCTSPFYGERCEKHYFIQQSCPSNMQKNFCQNGGSCIPINVGRDTLYYCKCVSQYYGSRCEYCEEQLKKGVCPSHLNTDLCKNGGTCITIKGAGEKDLYYCKCPEGLYGLSCEYPYPHLATVGRPCPACLDETYCLHGGTCYREDIMGNSVYHCECVYPYHGERCETEHPKQPNCPNQFKYFLCLNSGTCVQSKSNGHNIYICICQDGYYGPRCEHTCGNNSVEFCEDQFSRELCKNGGTCVSVKFPSENKLLFCKCQAGVFGTSCEYPFLPLLDKSTLCPPDVSKYFCMNGGTCYKDMDPDDIFYYCSCPDTYFGERCELNVGGQVLCPTSPFKVEHILCLNGGSCALYQTHSHNIYLCNCVDGFYGPRCEYSRSTKDSNVTCPYPIDNVLCMNGATCTKFAIEKEQHIYLCMCAKGYYGIICEHRIPPETSAGEYCPPELAENWCQNGGTCYQRHAETEGDKDYYCHCVEPFQGARCEGRHPKELPCPHVLDKFLCVNGGVCTRRFFPNRIGFYYYCDCPIGYSGARCENTTLIERKVKYCGASFCENGGKCLEEVIGGTFHCSCLRGYYGERCQLQSKEGNPCPPEYQGHICFNGGNCLLRNTTKLEITYCECQAGYYGQQCEFTEPKKPSRHCPIEINKFFCLNGGTCVEETIHKQHLYYCECPEQNFGLRCEYKSPKAGSSDLPGFCQNCGKSYSFKFSGYTVYYCVCDAGYHGSICQYTMQELVTQLCSPEISEWFCFNGGTCFQGTVNNNADYYCICPVGFAGHRCQYNATDLQKCTQLVTTYFCKNGGSCKTGYHSPAESFYLCECPAGYGGRRCDYVNHRLDVCPVSVEDSFCLNNGTCRAILFVGHIIYYCECQSAFYGTRCEVTFPVEFQNETCPENIAQHFCLNNGSCLQIVQQKLIIYVCKCEDDFWGERCEYTYLDKPYCPIEFHNFYCLNGGTCYQLTVGKEIFYHCECLKNFFGSRCESQFPLVGPESERCIGEIDTYFCLNNGTCYQSVVNNEVFYFCVCSGGWLGLRCEEGPVIKQNCPSELEEKYCLHNGTCIKLQIGIVELYYCRCARGFEGTRCEYSLPYDTDPCSALLSGMYCLNGGTCSKMVVLDEEFYLCDCPEGFWGRQCEFSTLIRNLCPPQLDTSFCLNGGTCYQLLVDDKDLYYCVCTNIYYGKRCENSYVESHESQPCQPEISTEICLNGGSCYEVNEYGPKLFYCECAEGYSGQRCEHQNTGYLHISHLNMQNNLQRSSSSVQMEISFLLLLLWFSLCYKTIF